MKIFLLIHEQDTDSAWGCDVRSFLRKSAAQAAMRKEWEEAVAACEYNEREQYDEDECRCDDDTAVIRDGEDVEFWRIEAQEPESNKDATYITVWDDGIVVSTNCEIELSTNRVLNVETADVDGLDILLDEYVLIDGVRYELTIGDDGDSFVVGYDPC